MVFLDNVKAGREAHTVELAVEEHEDSSRRCRTQMGSHNQQASSSIIHQIRSLPPAHGLHVVVQRHPDVVYADVIIACTAGIQ